MEDHDLDAEIRGVSSDNPIENLKNKEKQIAGMLPYQWIRGPRLRKEARRSGKTWKQPPGFATMYPWNGKKP
jgi:hypothetical protein